MSSLKRNIVGSLVVLGITAGLIAWQLYSKVSSLASVYRRNVTIGRDLT